MDNANLFSNQYIPNEREGADQQGERPVQVDAGKGKIVDLHMWETNRQFYFGEVFESINHLQVIGQVSYTNTIAIVMRHHDNLEKRQETSKFDNYVALTVNPVPCDL